MHPIFDKLTRALSGDFMRRDDCCGGNGGEPAVKCCKKEHAPQRMNEREADTLIGLLYGERND